eukprot:15326891-Ditylum_brightwellii.AAC.1
MDPLEITGVDPLEITGVEDERHGSSTPGPDDNSQCTDSDKKPTESKMFRQAEELGRLQAQDPSQQPAKRKTLAREQDFVYQTMKYMNDIIEGANLHQQIPEKMFFAAMAPHADKLMTFLTEQMSAKKGLKVFGDREIAALEKELKWLIHCEVMHPVDVKSLTRNQKISALRYLMFLKEKRSCEVKGRGCTDGRKQRVYKTKGKTHAPTVSTEAICITAIFDAMEGRDVA